MSKLPSPRYTLWETVNAALTLAMRALEEVRIAARTPGPRGPDGFGFEDMEETVEDEGRIIVRRYKRGDLVKEFRHVTSVMLYRGVYKEGLAYQRGDTVTWSGSLWHCGEDTADKPGNGSKAWTLAAKRGGDGKPGTDGKPGDRGPEGRPGRDGALR